MELGPPSAGIMHRRFGLVIAQTLLGAGLLAAWIWIVDLSAVANTLQQAQWGYVAIAASLGIVSTILRAIRWRLILRPIAVVQSSHLAYIFHSRGSYLV
jgi:uncharacterized membrane protein YbhN (UPF0104 family)